MDISCKTQKDERFLEQTRHGEAEFPFRFYKEDVWAFDFHCIDWHWHPEVEFIYAEKGEISCFVGTEQFILPEGCGMFVNSGVLHRYEAARSVSMPNIVFSPELLGAKSGRVYQKYIAPVLGAPLPISCSALPQMGSAKYCSIFSAFSACRKQEITNCRPSQPSSDYGSRYICISRCRAGRDRATRAEGRSCK